MNQSSGSGRSRTSFLQCINCHATYPLDSIRYHCDLCRALLAIERQDQWHKAINLRTWAERALNPSAIDQSGVWAFREAVLEISPEDIVTHPEGRTHLYQRDRLSTYAGVRHLQLKHEGENPTGSFKDRGMTVAVSQAKALGLTKVACASTGNTSASLAAYAAHAGMDAIVFVPAGKTAAGKLAQALGYGAKCLAIKGDFDAAMRLVQEAARSFGIYLVNSLNPFRLEGQKTIVFEMLAQKNWQAPDWLIVPAGNLGNTSAFGKALREAYDAGWIKKLPRLVSVQAEGANPFYKSFQTGLKDLVPVRAETIATAIRIGDPVNFPKAKKAIRATQGLVIQVNDHNIMAAKKELDRSGIGCEPASAAALAGVRQLTQAGIIKNSEDVVAILTGHMLKDIDAILNGMPPVVEVDPTLAAVERAIFTPQ